MRFHLAILILLIVSVSPSTPAPHQPHALRDAMAARLEAVWNKDAAAWSRLTADEFTVVVPEGVLMSKADRLAALKLEKPEHPHAVTREQIRAYGDTVVRRFVDGNEWVLEIWARDHGVWRVVAAQVNLVKQ